MRASVIISIASDAALRAVRVLQGRNDDEPMSADEWRAMYEAQCFATDEWAKRAKAAEAAIAPPELTARIEELENALAKVNGRLAEQNQDEILAGFKR